MNGLTNNGQQAALLGSGIPAVATHLRLYTSASIPAVNGTGFVEATDSGYTAQAINASNWTFSVVQGAGRITLSTITFTASGSQLSNIAGVFLTDASNNVLAWWAFSPSQNVANGGTYTLSGLYIG